MKSLILNLFVLTIFFSCSVEKNTYDCSYSLNGGSFYYNITETEITYCLQPNCCKDTCYNVAYGTKTKLEWVKELESRDYVCN